MKDLIKEKFKISPKLKKTIIVFHIIAFIYFLLAIMFWTFPGVTTEPIKIGPKFVYNEKYTQYIGLFLATLGILVEVVVIGLKNRKYWAWIVGIIISGLQLFSFPGVILGIVGLVGLLNKETRTIFTRR